MQHLFEEWPTFSGAIMTAPHVLLLSDYDGTLTPIVSRPDDALLSPDVRHNLQNLVVKHDFSAGIISGRAIGEIKSLVGIEGIFYAGNHGLEIEGPGLDFVAPQAAGFRDIIRTLAGQLSRALGGIRGVIVEDKGLSLSVHYRLVAAGERQAVEDVFRQLTWPLELRGKIKVTSGKMVWEARPPLDWHKGKAVATIIDRIMRLLIPERMVTLYLGDDTTDEDAFAMLRRPDEWGIYVGGDPTSSKATYYLDSTEEVAQLLERLLALKT